MNTAKFRKIWDTFFEYDRIAERKIKRSIMMWNSGNIFKMVYAMLSYNNIRKKYGCSINPRIKVGDNLYISHAQDIVIGQTSEIGNNCRIFPGVKIIARVEGDKELANMGKRRHPKIGNDCMLGCDCIIIGPITIGNNVSVGAGAIVTRSVPDNCVVIGTNIVKNKNDIL